MVNVTIYDIHGSYGYWIASHILVLVDLFTAMSLGGKSSMFKHMCHNSLFSRQVPWITHGVGMPSWPRKKSFRIYWETIWLEGELENSQEWGDESAKKLHIQEVLEYCAEVTGKRYGTDQTGELGGESADFFVAWNGDRFGCTGQGPPVPKI